MKVAGETFSFYHKRKGAEEVRYQKYLNFQAKGPLPDRTLESFIPKSTDGSIPIFLGKFLTESTLINESFPDFLRKNLSGKRTE